LNALGLPIVLRCEPTIERRAGYVLDTLLQAAGVPACRAEAPPPDGPWILYAANGDATAASRRCLHLWHDATAWQALESALPAPLPRAPDAAPALVFAGRCGGVASGAPTIDFDLPLNAFYFLSSWAERRGPPASRRMYAGSEFVRLGLPQDVVDAYLARLIEDLDALMRCCNVPSPEREPTYPGGHGFAVVLSHDVDYLPVRPADNFVQGAKSVLRHLVHQRDPADAWRAARGWSRALVAGRDPYGCVPEIIARERTLGVCSSFMIAVGHRDPRDVNYHIDDDRVRDYLRAVDDAGFEIGLHGSCRSTEEPHWYVEEVQLLSQRLARPAGSRQHFLSFDYDALFAAQEAAGIRYDMSMGFPDRPGARAGFSFPYFPYNLREERPYRVLQISLFLMDVTLRGYMGLRPDAAQPAIDACLADLQAKRGCASVVWHPIVFGGARDPGYDELYFRLIEQVRDRGGLATDGRTIAGHWRDRARRYPSFQAVNR
jgi:hypothetical protein